MARFPGLGLRVGWGTGLIEQILGSPLFRDCLRPVRFRGMGVAGFEGDCFGVDCTDLQVRTGWVGEELGREGVVALLLELLELLLQDALLLLVDLLQLLLLQLVGLLLLQLLLGGEADFVLLLVELLLSEVRLLLKLLLLELGLLLQELGLFLLERSDSGVGIHDGLLLGGLVAGGGRLGQG